MANRYWVGGTGNWSDTAHWSSTSGGAGGQTVPTSSDNVFIDSNSGGGTVTLDVDANVATFYQESATIDANNKNITGNGFTFYANTGLTPTVYMGSGTWEVIGSAQTFEFDEFSGQTVNFIPETSTIKLNCVNGSYQELYAGGDTDVKTFHNLYLTSSGTGIFNIYGTLTFNNITIDPKMTARFEASKTTTISSLTATGTSGNNIVLTYQPGNTGQFTLSKSAGVVDCDYLTISNSIATGGATWYAGSNSTNGGNNSGWLFQDAPGWTNQSKNTASITNQSKNSSSPTNTSKSSGSWINRPK